MDNREIYKVCQTIAHRLKALGLVESAPKAKQPIFDVLRPILKGIDTGCAPVQPTANQANTHKQTDNTIDTKDTDKKGTGSNPSPDPTPEALRTRLRQHLMQRLDSGSLQAAEIQQLKDIFNLNNETLELQIQVVDYANIPTECPQCGADLTAAKRG